ncbi:AAA family ATPase [Spirosoma foliorum]|uniref:AAA family ATPase n=1 Tax=Spirosoma foliorum TaxID=2710596 RepID=A0A7G5GMN7_9BACT|nr:AAA family ATPase [Spirosoma foliorum]QMW00129.1 AAA family ATPase [Spirosoma foliorum]
MYITKVELQNFKRFTDLTIDGIPTNAKLVLLIGSNGSGKSSVFDAFEFLNTGSKTHIHQKSGSEYKGAMQSLLSSLSSLKKRRDLQTTIFIEDNQGESSRFEETKSPISISKLSDKAFYGRTSFRQVARLTRRQSEENSVSTIEADSDRPRTFIDRDNRFEADIDRIARQIFQEIFRNGASAQQIKDKYIEPINQAFDRIFDSQLINRLSLIEFIPPGEGQATQVNFRKGESEISYDYLSAGEKEVFNILFNLLVRRDQFTDTVYFFDEIDLHLNTKLQFNLLKEITENWIPENCQLWTASHSLGFIDYARQYEKGVIIDFDDLDFDQPQTLFPEPKERLDVYDIAVPKEMLFEIMKDKKVVACENQNAEFYNLLALPNTIFVGMKDARSVFLQVKNDPRYHSLRDRDFISDTEIEKIESIYPNHHILRYYNFENYLYHPDNLTELNPTGFDRATYIKALNQYKQERYDYILPGLISSRQTYEEFKTDDKLKDKSTDSIVHDLKSDDFERFYKYLNMKNQHEKIDPALGKIPQKSLVQTNWFRQQIQAILNR